MGDDWDDSPSGNTNDSQSVDTGRNFSRGRGFSKQPSSGPGNDDGGWGDENDSWGSNTRGSRGGGRRGGRGGFDRNGNDDFNNDGGFGSRGGRGGGRGRGGRGGGRGGFQNNGDGDEWGNAEESNDEWGSNSRGRGRGGRGGGRGGFRSNNDEWGNGDDNKNNDWGDSNRRGGGRFRGGGRGGRNDDNGDGDDWGGGGGGDTGGEWGDDSGRGRGRGRGRGGRGGGRGGGGGGFDGDDNDGDKPEKPREIYIPPEPTTDETEMFGTSITSGINFDKYDNIPVQVTGENIVPSITSFQEAGLRDIVMENIRKSGYTRPTPIQKTALPIIMAGRDLMACAQTGSGKTAAFLVPIINNLLEKKTDLIVGDNHCEPQVVIVSPTRELAVQIEAEARKFAHDSVIRTVVTYGGTAVRNQIERVLRGCHILVATPGRMNDFVNRNVISFKSIRCVVLDEADRMLDMGFRPAIEEMMHHSTMVETSERQTLMFSATFPEEVQRLASQYLNNYLFVTIGIVGGACSDVQQVFHQVDKFSKRQKLLDLLNEEGAERTLVFVETKRNADFIATYLSENNVSTTSIHGDRVQSQREEALRDFKSGRRDVLVATDVAARGLDIKNVKHVINYDLPKSIDEYVHRIGRTGRVGNRGKATSFYDDSKDGQVVADLLRIMKQANQSIPDWLESAAAGGGGSFNSGRFGGRDVRGDSFGQATDFNSGATQEPEEEW